MARILWCPIHGICGVLVIETKTICLECRGPVEWRETDPASVPFTLTMMDRRLLQSLRIGTE